MINDISKSNDKESKRDVKLAFKKYENSHLGLLRGHKNMNFQGVDSN